MEYYRQAKEANKPFSFSMMDLTMRDDEGEKIVTHSAEKNISGSEAVILGGCMNDRVTEEYWKYGFVGAMVKPYPLQELKSSPGKIPAGDGLRKT